MRILMGMPASESVGGPVACEPPFVEELRRLGVQVDEEIYVYGDKLARKTRFWERILRVLRVALILRQRVSSGRYDLVHLNTTVDLKALLRDLVTVYLLHSSGSRIFLKLHGSDDQFLKTSRRLLRFLMRTLFSKVDGIGVLSTEERDNFLSFGVDKRKIFLMKCALKKAHYRRDLSFARRYNIEEGVPVLLFISRFIPTKGLIDVIRACHLLRQSGCKFALLCVGDGPTRREAEEEVANLRLQQHVRFYGYIPERETDDFYANSDILLYPTYHFEGLPGVVLNSLAAGIPIITTRIRGTADYLSEPDNCLWVESKQPEMLAEKITQVLSQPEVRAMMMRNNRVLAQQFTAKRVAQEYLEAYYQLIAGQADAPEPHLSQITAAFARYQNPSPPHAGADSALRLND